VRLSLSLIAYNLSKHGQSTVQLHDSKYSPSIRHDSLAVVIGISLDVHLIAHL